MDATTTLTELQNSGVILTLTGDSLRWRGPSGAMTTALRAALVANKSEVRRLLALKPTAEPVRIDTLPPTIAGLNRALTILRGATGCPPAEADALLSQWDALNVAYTDGLGRDPLPVWVSDQIYQAALL